MAKNDLTTYEVWFNDEGDANNTTKLMDFQDEIGLDDATVKANAVLHLQAMIDQIESTPGTDTISIRVGVIYPPAHSVRQRNKQDNTNQA